MNLDEDVSQPTQDPRPHIPRGIDHDLKGNAPRVPH